MNDRHPPLSRRCIVAAGLVAAGRASAQAVSPPQKRPKEYDVRDYDAIGDGRTDDTESIRSAIAAASTAGGAVVSFPPGVYNVSSTIKVPGNPTLRGYGRASTIHGSTDNLTILSLGDCRGTVVEGCGSPGRACWPPPAGGPSGSRPRTGPGRSIAR